MLHLALLGDSVFDNRAYIGGAPDVATHLRGLLPTPSTVTLCAVDGATTFDVGHQFDRVPSAATHLFVSLGGNDALLNADLLDLPVKSTGEALDLFRDRLVSFSESYGHALEGLLDLRRPVCVCTIYNGNLPQPEAARAPLALAFFNDVIVRTALRFGVQVLELRAVCTETSDYANPIEPSNSGGRKIAEAIVRALDAETPRPGRAVLTT